MTAEKRLYVWLEGDVHRPAAPPKIQVKIAPDMPLTDFRDRYVDTTHSHVVIRVYHASDDAGREYRIVPVAEAASSSIPGDAMETGGGTSLTLIKGIGRGLAARFQRADIHTIEDFLAAAATADGRASLASAVGRSPATVLRWAQIADLMRVNGIGGDYGALLWHSGILTLRDLQLQTPSELIARLETTNRRMALVQRLPAPAQVADWIAQAQTLTALII